MISQLKERWEELEPEKREKATKIGVFSILGVLAVAYWYVAKDGNNVHAAPQQTLMPVAIGEELFKDDISRSITQQGKEQEARNVNQDTRLQEIAKRQEALDAVLERLKTEPLVPAAIDTALKPPTLAEAGSTEVPRRFPASPPRRDGARSAPAFEENSQRSLEEASPIIIGGISHFHYEPTVVASADSSKKKVTRKVWLAPSWMEAMLLTGLDASTVEGANAHPQPMMVRVQAPAVLPNSVKAALEGCFLIVNGFGALNSERIETRLVSLSCLSRDGHALIDTPIKGYLADQDGKSGLSGHVVSKAGAHLARIFIAGAVGGLGRIAEQAAQTVTISPLATQTTSIASMDKDKALGAALGGGLADTSKEVRQMFLDLAKQASPIIEVGPAKSVTAVVTEGVWLEIKESGDV